MSGGYISCGSFMGADKSGSAFEGLLQAIAQFLPAEESRQFQDTVIDPVLGGGYSEEQTLTVPVDVVPLLQEPLRRYYDHLGQQLGHPLPQEAPDLDKEAGLEPVEAKWEKAWDGSIIADMTCCKLATNRSARVSP